MEKKISASVLVDELAARLNLPQTVSEEFVRAFFDTIIDGLRKDGLVKIKGFGTFKLSEVSDRESVAVATGERIVIKGFRKVTFTPEAAVKDHINKPFAQFETIELDDACHFDDVPETIASETDDTAEDSAVTVVEETVEVRTPVEETSGEVALVEEPSPEVAEQGSEPAEPAASVEEVQTESSSIPSTEETLESASETAESIATAETEPETEAIEESVEEVAQPVAEVTDEPVQEEQPLTEETVSKPEPKEEEDFVYYTEKPRHRAFWRYWLPALILAIAACCLYIYVSLDGKDSRFDTYRPSENDMIKVQPIAFDDDNSKKSADTAPKNVDEKVVSEAPAVPAEEKKSDEPKVEPKPEPKPEPKTSDTNDMPGKNDGKPYILQLTETDKAKNLKDITAADTTEYIIDGTLVTHELQKDETIIRLALMYYGDKRLWPYIVKYNWLKNPDSVPVGTALNIPYLKNK